MPAKRESIFDWLSRMAQATIPTTIAPNKDTADSQSVARKHSRYSGMYSSITLKLNVSIMLFTRKARVMEATQTGVSRFDRLTRFQGDWLESKAL
jgi:hypothetical protein